MKQFSLTAASFEGSVTFKYNDDGYLTYYSLDAELNEEGLKWLLVNLPLTIDEMHRNILKFKGFKAVEIDATVTFQQFWDKYDEKLRSSKARSQKIWDKMNDADRLKAYQFIAKYDRIRGSADKKYAETYLRAQQWNN